MPWGTIAVSALVAMLGPTGLAGLWLLRQQRRKLDASADVDEAQAYVATSTELRALVKAATEDAQHARRVAADAERLAAKCRRLNLLLWARVDGFDRWCRHLEQAVRDLGGTVPTRPLDLDHPITDSEE